MNQRVAIIHDEKEVEVLRLLREFIVEGIGHFRREWSTAQKCVVVPIESGTRPTRELIGNIVSGFSTSGFEFCYGISTESAPELPECFLIEVSEQGFLEFDELRNPFNCLVLTKDGQKAVLFTFEEYYLIGGSREFVSTVLGESVEEGRVRFRKFATEDWGELVRTRDFLISVADRYENT